MRAKKSSLKLVLALCTALGGLPLTGHADAPAPQVENHRPWMEASLSADRRADLLLAQMTMDEKLLMVFGYFASDAPWKNFKTDPKALPNSAGYVPGIDRLGIPAQWETDAGVGVATQRTEHPRERTALPSGLATAATWNPELAYKGGAMIGNEAYLSGFNVMLAGGVNLIRDARNGRNFEYGGEDPLLAGIMVGQQIAGIQSNHIISTVKHFAFNDLQTEQFHHTATIEMAAGRMSDLLAFQIAMEIGKPGSVMCAYNRVGGDYACENPYLLNETLKGDWGFKGYVMSDWGSTHSTIPAANNGLDQQSGYPFDESPYFQGALNEAVLNEHVSPARLDDMVRRILWAMFDKGVFDHPVTGDQSKTIDFDAHARITQADAEEAIVLLKNENGLLPIAKSAQSIVVIGGHADKGVLSGGGSSQVYPRGGMAVPNEGPSEFPGPMVFYPDAPVTALRQRTTATITYLDGKDHKAAKKAAAKADLVIVFATQWMAEGIDAPDLALPDHQNELILAVASKKTIVVLETGGPVAMPWLNRVGAVLEAWYPGTRGGTAIARVLTGEVNPSGHLPVTFPASASQLPRPDLAPFTNRAAAPRQKLVLDFNIEGAAVGYRWFDLKGHRPLFPFGHGLSYGRFALSHLFASTEDKTVTVGFTVTNRGKIAGKAVGQVYVAPASKDWEAPKRLAGFTKLDLKAGEARSASISVDPRLLAVFDSASKRWIVKGGTYRFMLGTSASDIVQTVDLTLPDMSFDVNGK